jgi:hypothetical protein
MSLDEFIPVRTVFYETVGNFSRRQLDYWDTLIIRECPLFPIFQVKFILDRNFLITYRVIELLASIQRPETWFEMIFGPSKAETVPRYIYENKEEGFYNFYRKL